MSALRPSLCVAVVWGIWHAPLLGTEFAWEVVPAFLVSVVAAAIVLAWLFNASRGSVLLPMLMHATVNTVAAGLVFRWVPEDQLTLFWFIYAAVWAADRLRAGRTDRKDSRMLRYAAGTGAGHQR